MSDHEVSANFGSVLENLRRGVEVVVEQDHHPVAVIKPSKPAGRMISECIAVAKARGSTVTLDDGFAKDIEEGIASHSEPWNPPAWE